MTRGMFVSFALTAGTPDRHQRQQHPCRPRCGDFNCARRSALTSSEGGVEILLLEAEEERQMEAQVRLGRS
jgi:hypothetical protein